MELMDIVVYPSVDLLCFRIRNRYEGRGNRGNGGYSGVEDGVKERNKRLECEMMM